jgi:hypothetical protein
MNAAMEAELQQGKMTIRSSLMMKENEGKAVGQGMVFDDEVNR